MAELDFKDLEILDELYKTRSVSQAVEKVGLSQPSISIRLGRLRKHFHDPLFVRTSRGMQPTPRADALIPAIHHALSLFDDSLRRFAQFDPVTSDRKFKICMTDVGQSVVLPRLLTRIKSMAPAVRIDVMNLNAETPRLLESGDADLALGYTLEMQSGFYQQALLNDRFVCMVSRDHPRIRARITRKQFEAEEQIDVVTRGTGHWLLYKALEDAAVARRVTVRVPSFLGLAQIVAHTELLALVPGRMGAMLAAGGNVRTLAAPIRLPSYVVKQYWHERYHRDPGNAWFRGVISNLYDVARTR